MRCGFILLATFLFLILSDLEQLIIVEKGALGSGNESNCKSKLFCTNLDDTQRRINNEKEKNIY
jgi:hypothetical protein